MRLKHRVFRGILRALPSGGRAAVYARLLAATGIAEEESRRQTGTGAGRIPVSILSSAPPWAADPRLRSSCPSMLSLEERAYYEWLGELFEGNGAALEIGPWLGSSTLHLMAGLTRSRTFQRLHVIDDFIWRPHMDRWVSQPLAAGESFRHLFEMHTAAHAAQLVVRQRRVARDTLNASVEPLTWDGSPIELLVVDCGMTFAVNEGWFSTLGPSLLPGRSVVVMQDWQSYKRVPREGWLQTKAFTDAHQDRLELLHELRHGELAAFRVI